MSRVNEHSDRSELVVRGREPASLQTHPDCCAGEQGRGELLPREGNQYLGPCGGRTGNGGWLVVGKRKAGEGLRRDRGTCLAIGKVGDGIERVGEGE